MKSNVLKRNSEIQNTEGNTRKDSGIADNSEDLRSMQQMIFRIHLLKLIGNNQILGTEGLDNLVMFLLNSSPRNNGVP